VALGQPPRGERDQGDADRHVEPEDPLPGDAVDDGAADHRPERDAEAGHAGPRADREPATVDGDGVREQRQRERRDDGGADALHGPRRDQRARRGSECRRGRRQREDAEAEDEHAATAEAIAERGAGEQEHRVGQGVGVDRPLQRLDRGAEVGANGRQGGGDDEVVEHDHEERDRHDREGPAGT
jgi:hypothetical protein